MEFKKRLINFFSSSPSYSFGFRQRQKLKQKIFISLLFSLFILFGNQTKILSPKLQFLLATTIIFWTGFPIFLPPFKNLLHLTLSSELLVSLGIIIPYLYSATAAFFPQHFSQESSLFFHTSTLILSVILIGQYFERTLLIKTENFSQKFPYSLPKKVTLIKNNKPRKISFKKIKKGDLILCSSQEKIPADGQIQQGIALVNERMITGQGTPVYKNPKDKVFAGTRNLSGSILIKVIKTGHQTLVYQALKVIGQPPPYQNSKYNLIILIIAVLTFFFWYLFFDQPLALALLTATTILVVANSHLLTQPDKILLSIAQNLAFKNGIVIKNPQGIKILPKSDVLLFEKTGILNSKSPKNFSWAIFSPDIPHQHAQKTLDFFYQKNKKVILFSDNDRLPTQIFAKSLKIKNFFWGLSLSQKKEQIKKIKMENPNSLITFIGHPLKDSSLFKTADLGIAVKTNSPSLFKTSAQIALITNNINLLSKVYKISQKSLNIIKQNNFFCFLYSLIFLPLAAGILYPFGVKPNPLFAAVCMNLSLGFLLLNSLRLKKLQL